MMRLDVKQCCYLEMTRSGATSQSLFAQNFERFGLKKLISTSYAAYSKIYKYQPTLFETNDPQYDKDKTPRNGKIYTLTHDKTDDGKIDVNDLEWHYLEGEGDFKSY